jgi:hypothetical protein
MLLLDGSQVRRKVHVSLTCPWSQQNDEYHRCHTWENTESNNLASEVRWRKSRPTTTGGIWSLLFLFLEALARTLSSFV